MDQRWIDYWSGVIEVFDYRKAPGREGVPASFYVPRPDSPLKDIENRLRLNLHTPQALAVTGHRGSGKSSELARLSAELSDRMTVLLVDTSKRLDVQQVGQTELILAMAASLHQRFPVPAEFAALTERLATVAHERLEERSAALVLKALERLGVESRFSLFDRQTRQRIELPLVMGALVDGLNQMIRAAALKTGGKPLLMIVEGTDQLDLEAARPIFANNRLLADIQCHLVLTIPFALYSSVAQGEVQQQGFQPFYVPNVKLGRREQGELSPDSLALMQAIVARRLAHVNAPDRLEAGALRRFVEVSGGVIRELIYMINQACVQATLVASERITPAIAETVIHQYRLQKSWGLRYDYFYEELARVHDTGSLSDRREKDEQGREFVVCDRLLHNLYLLGYRNGAQWFDVHPLVRPLVEGYPRRPGRAPVAA